MSDEGASAPGPARARRYAGLTAEARQAERRERLLEAVLGVVGADGVTGLSVQALCVAAGLSKRYFYEAFATVDEAVAATLERVMTQVAERVDAATPGEGGSTEAVLRGAVSGVLEVMDDPRVARLFLEAPAFPAADAVREAAVALTVQRLLGHVLGPELAARPRVRLVGILHVSGTTHVLGAWLRGELEITREELVDDLVDVGLAGAARARRLAGARDD